MDEPDLFIFPKRQGEWLKFLLVLAGIWIIALTIIAALAVFRP